MVYLLWTLPLDTGEKGMSVAKTEPEVVVPAELPSFPFSFRTAYSRFSLVLLALIAVSLLPHYHALLTKSAAISLALIIHAALYLIWFLLFTVQSSLISSRHTALHMKLGYWSIALFLLLMASGVYMMVGTMRSIDASWNAQQLASRASFVWGILHTLLSFAVFYCLAIGFRFRPQAHKRFMLLAALSMISASVTRVAYLPFIPIDGTALVLLSTYAFLITPMIIDRVQLKRIHPVLKWGVPTYIVTQILCIGFVPTTQWGKALAFPF